MVENREEKPTIMVVATDLHVGSRGGLSGSFRNMVNLEVKR
jgi:hypothetical protein